MDEHELVSALKALALELGKIPTRREFTTRHRGADYSLTRTFGTYIALVKAAGMETHNGKLDRTIESPFNAKSPQALLREYKALCSRREQIQGFFRTVLDLKDLFERAGNPPVLKLLAQGDTHAKFVDRAAFNAYKKFASYYCPDIHLIMGDFVDCEGLSHWPPDDLEPRRIVPEMKIGRALLQETVESTPTCSTRLFLEGNHERWIEQAFTKMPELFDGLAELDIEINVKTLLGLSSFGYEFFPLNELLQIGGAHFTHGLYTGKHHAAKHLDTFKTNIYYGHLHDTQEHNQTGIDGHVEASCLGCLCRKDAKFLKGKPNNWVHTAPVFEFFPDGSYNHYKPRIFNGRMAFNGMVFDGN